MPQHKDYLILLCNSHCLIHHAPQHRVELIAMLSSGDLLLILPIEQKCGLEKWATAKPHLFHIRHHYQLRSSSPFILCNLADKRNRGAAFITRKTAPNAKEMKAPLGRHLFISKWPFHPARHPSSPRYDLRWINWGLAKPNEPTGQVHLWNNKVYGSGGAIISRLPR
jgi:hypothetical protein